MPDKYLLCENCHQVVARFDPATIRLPIRSTMFESKFHPDRQVPSPWAHRDVEAEWMKCPQCPKRVFNVPEPDSLYTADRADGIGPYRLKIKGSVFVDDGLSETDSTTAPLSNDQDNGNTELCPVCGKSREDFKNASGFANHVRYCTAKHGGRAQ